MKELVTMDEAVTRLNQIKDEFYSRVDAETDAFFEKLSEEIVAAGFERVAKEHFQIQDVDPVTLKTCIKLWDSIKVSSWNLLPGDEPIISCVAKRSKMSREICLVDDSGQEFWFDYPLEIISNSCSDMKIKAESRIRRKKKNMSDVVSINDSIEETKKKLQSHGINVPYYGWEIMLYLTLNTFSNKKAKIVGFGDDATFEEVVE